MIQVHLLYFRNFLCHVIRVHVTVHLKRNLRKNPKFLKILWEKFYNQLKILFQNNYIQPSRSISGSGSSSDDDSCPNRSVTLRDLYSLRQVLSDTSNGTVFSGRRRRDGRPVAIKRIMRNKVKRWGIVRDRQVNISLRHCYVITS